MSYLGQGLGLGREERFTATATAGQTTVTVGDDGRSISYTPNYVDVYLNGSKQVNGSDITVTSGTSIVFASALTAGDVVDVVAPGYFQPADTVSRSLGGTFLGAVNLPSGGLNVGSGQLKVDSSGRVTMGNVPAFKASRVTNASPGSGFAIFDTVTNNGGFNQGSCYNTATGKFTAPVAGVYQFNVHVSYQNAAATDYVYLNVNGSNYVGNDQYTHSGWDFAAYSVCLKLAVNDVVGVYLNIASSINIPEAGVWSSFSGHLVG